MKVTETEHNEGCALNDRRNRNKHTCTKKKKTDEILQIRNCH